MRARSFLLTALAVMLLIGCMMPLSEGSKGSGSVRRGDDAAEGQCKGEAGTGQGCGAGGGGDGDEEEYEDGEGGEDDGGDYDSIEADEKDVVVLTKDNFYEETKKHKFLLVEFYAPWCGHCQILKPEFAEAATKLAQVDPPVTLAKIDATQANEIAEKFEVGGFPTMKWFLDGEVQPLAMEERSSQGIVKWCKKQSGEPAPVANSMEMLNRIADESRFVALGFFEAPSGKAYEAFINVAKRDSRNDYHIVTDGDLAKAYKVAKRPAIVFVRRFDEPRIDYKGAMKEADIEEAVRASSIRTVIPFLEENQEEIFRNELPKVMIFGADRKDGGEEEFHELAVQFKGKFVFTNVGEGSDPQLWEFIGASDDANAPEVFVFLPEKNSKYRMEESFSAKAGKAFLDSYLKGEAKPFLKSADVKEGWDKETVKEVAALQFADMIKQGDRPHYVLMVYAPWCGHCKEFGPKYDKAAAYFENKFGDEVVFAKMDGTENELENMAVSGFPTVFVFPKHMLKMNGPTDVSTHTSDLKVFASEVRKTCGLTLVKREGEAEYEEAARRFKAAVKLVKGSLADVASILNEAAEKVERMAPSQEAAASA